jgi:hypothetical protein
MLYEIHNICIRQKTFRNISIVLIKTNENWIYWFGYGWQGNL